MDCRPTTPKSAPSHAVRWRERSDTSMELSGGSLLPGVRVVDGRVAGG